MMSPKYVTQTKLAELLGCTQLTVSRLIKKGELKVNKQGKLDISTPEIQRYIEHKKVDLELHRKRIASKQVDKQVTKQVNSSTNTNNTSTTSFNQHELDLSLKQQKLESEHYKTKLLELEVQKEHSELFSAELVQRLISKTIVNLQQHLLELPESIMDELLELAYTEAEAKPLMVSLLTRRLQQQFLEVINITKIEFKRVTH